jgi:benzoate-CoA ligase
MAQNNAQLGSGLSSGFYNAAVDLIDRNLREGVASKLAFIDDQGSITYSALSERVNRCANALRAMGLQHEDRIMIAMLDSIDWPTVFLGAIKAGIVPVCVNTLLKPQDYAYMLADSRVKALFVSDELWPAMSDVAKTPFLKHIVLPAQLKTALIAASPNADAAPTKADEACFWLYSSGSTGSPKGTVHVHSSLMATADLYAKPILGITQKDVVFSAAKLFFAYGLGNGLTFPMAVGATGVLMAERPTPDAVFKRISEHQPSIFYGVPTLYAAMLASPNFPSKEKHNLRVCTSAGEALPEQIGTRFTALTGVEVLDGIGSTEMLHIFLSNRPGEVRYGTTGKAVPGYDIKLVGEDDNDVAVGDIGDLYIRGSSAAQGYWNQREKSRTTFQGEWTKSGDKYSMDADGYYTYAGRSDDMLKVSGQYVSPFEVESAIASHGSVFEAAVVGMEDAEHLIKPKAFVVLKPGASLTEDELKQHVKAKLAPFKYPRWVEFVDELPKTATGKIQRFKLRS